MTLFFHSIRDFGPCRLTTCLEAFVGDLQPRDRDHITTTCRDHIVAAYTTGCSARSGLLAHGWLLPVTFVADPLGFPRVCGDRFALNVAPFYSCLATSTPKCLNDLLLVNAAGSHLFYSVQFLCGMDHVARHRRGRSGRILINENQRLRKTMNLHGCAAVQRTSNVS